MPRRPHRLAARRLLGGLVLALTLVAAGLLSQVLPTVAQAAEPTAIDWVPSQGAEARLGHRPPT